MVQLAISHLHLILSNPDMMINILLAILMFLAGRVTGYWKLFIWADILIIKFIKDNLIKPKATNCLGRGE